MKLQSLLELDGHLNTRIHSPKHTVTLGCNLC